MHRLAYLIVALLPLQAQALQVNLQPARQTGPVNIETTSIPGNLDGPKLQNSANLSSFDYWWFDLVSNTTNEALNIVFYNAGDIGNPQPLAVEVSGVFDNGTRFLNQALEPNGATISNSNDGVQGHWKGLKARFSGTNLEKEDIRYDIFFNSPEIGITGHVSMNSRAPAHYPCSPNTPGQTQLHLERFFWSNAIPDADVSVNVNINGTIMHFTGIGYHDKNWGDKTVLKSPKFWDWGHARVGPYSVVWYDLLDHNNTEYFRSYVAKENNIIALSCTDKAVVTRPWGTNVSWPPADGLNAVAGVISTFDLGNGKSLIVNVTKQRITYDASVYTRAMGSAKAWMSGEEHEIWEGRSFFDEFTYGLKFGLQQ